MTTGLDSEGNFVRVPVELWNKWMQEREDWRIECERLRRELDECGTKVNALETALWRGCNVAKDTGHPASLPT